LLAYLIILSTTVAGMMQAAWWAAVVGACILALLSVAERRAAFTSPTGNEGATDEPLATLVAVANGSVACSVAFMLGRATAWLWGI
jgi:hypothetical protein